jgi:hypothetical protein
MSFLIIPIVLCCNPGLRDGVALARLSFPFFVVDGTRTLTSDSAEIAASNASYAGSRKIADNFVLSPTVIYRPLASCDFLPFFFCAFRFVRAERRIPPFRSRKPIHQRHFVLWLKMCA